MMGSRVIAVIGSNSFSGSDFIDLLLDDPRNSVIGVSRSPEKPALFLPYKARKDADFRFFQLDLNTQLEGCLKLLDSLRPEYIVNFAAQSEVGPSWDNPEHWYQTNALSLVRLTNHLKDRDYLKKYVHISSPEVYGTCVGRVLESAPYNPSTPYAASKAAGDMFVCALAVQRGFPAVLMRATNVYGAHQQLWKIIPRSVIYIKMGKMITLDGGGKAVKSYIHIRDVSRGELAAMEHGKPGEVYHLSPSPESDGYEVREVVRRIAALMGRRVEDVARSGPERLGQDAAYVIDSGKARRDFGWKPHVTLDEGLRGVVCWIEANWAQISREPLEYRHTP
jgi:dTDP-glucose 4,6-dehydratase